MIFPFNRWISVSVGEVAQIIGGGTPSSGDKECFASPGMGIPWLTPADLSGYKNQSISRGGRDLTQKGLESCSAKLMPAGSVLFSSRAPIGYVAIAENQIATNQGFKSFVFPKEIDSRYAYYQFKYLKPVAEAMATGTTFKELSGSAASKLPFAIAPELEQIRIADKLDTVLTRVDACRDRLARVAPLLKRFRQSVLAAATSGRLTEDWRSTNAPEWLWRDVVLSDIADIQGGVTKDAGKQSASDEEVPYLRVANVQRCYLDLNDIRTIRVPPLKLESLLLKPGDILFNEGGDLDKLGRGWIWEGQIARCSFQNHVFRARLFDLNCHPKYISWWGNTQGLEYFVQNGKQTTNLASINKTMLKNLPISLPPLAEQTEIVRRVETLFAFADRLEARLKTAQAAADRLTPALLAKAFRGELVPQDPNDEPAAELLKRLAASRDAAPKARRGRRSATADTTP